MHFVDMHAGRGVAAADHRRVLFVDPGVADCASLLLGLRDGFEVVRLRAQDTSLQGWHSARFAHVAGGFYKSQALEWVRA